MVYGDWLLVGRHWLCRNYVTESNVDEALEEGKLIYYAICKTASYTATMLHFDKIHVDTTVFGIFLKNNFQFLNDGYSRGKSDSFQD